MSGSGVALDLVRYILSYVINPHQSHNLESFCFCFEKDIILNLDVSFLVSLIFPVCLYLHTRIHHAFSSVFSSVSYADHCSSVLPQLNVTASAPCNPNSPPYLSTPYFTGGDTLLRMQPGRAYYYVQKNLRLRIRQCFETTASGVYKVQGFLSIRFPYSSDDIAPATHTYSRARTFIKFSIDGFWSEESRKLCMVGSAPWKGFDRDAVLKLKFGVKNPTIYTAVASGSLESVSSVNNQHYFDPILIFDFPQFSSNYNYSLVPKEIGAMFPSVGKDESLSPEETKFCSVIRMGLSSLQLEYATDCTPPHGCELLPRFLSLTSTQCDEGGKKAMFLAEFQNHSYYSYDGFGVGSTLVGEMQWDDETKRVIGVACRILNPSQQFGDAVGDCDVRLILRFPSVLTIRNDAKIVGQIWSSKPVMKIRVAKHDDDQGQRVVALQGLRYEYTELDRARKSCTAKKPAKKGDAYPDGQAYDMRFDMKIKHNHGQQLGWAYATPSWVGNDSYRGHMPFAYAPESVAESGEILESADSHSPTKMSYKISIHPFYHANSSSNNISSPRLNWPMNPHGVVEITAEGLYDANGHLCMVGCRNLVQNSTHSSKDCDIVVEFELPPLNRKRGGLIKGSITSTRGNMDPLHFDDLILQSASHYVEVAERSIWRMDLEITMVLISNTLACIFVGLQIFHVKRNPEVPSLISLVMLVVLSLGHMIPLVLNFEAVFLENPYKQTLELGSGGRLEANEVAVRVITMVALLLQLRLVQLVWVAKQSDGNGKSWWSGEKKGGCVSLALYILGGMLSLVVKWLRKTNVGGRYSVWGDLRSYGGLILDGFLFPQILFNIFKGGSPQKALSHPFYIGMSSVRLVPHAYNQHRAHNYPKFDLNGTYYYANPAADFYSTAWDIIIPCGVVALAVVVFVQQRYGGRCIFPQRFRGLEMYEKVAMDETQ